MPRYPRKPETTAVVQQTGMRVVEDASLLAHYQASPAAASATGILGATSQNATAKTVNTGITQPAVPRNVTVKGKYNAAVLQVETATVVGTITGAGDAMVTITAADFEEPLEIGVTLAEADDAAAVGGKIRTALGLNAGLAALFTIGGANATVSLTRKVAAANDATLNIAIDNSTCAGLTAAPTSANTTAGVLKSAGNVVINGTNVNDDVITETIALNGTTEVVGAKAFKTITSVVLPARLNADDTVSVGIGSKLGLNHKLPHNTVLLTVLNNTVEGTAPTVTVSSTAVESNTILLNSSLDGNQVDCYYIVP